MTARVALRQDYRHPPPAPRAAWPLHRVLQAACAATVWTDGARWHIDGHPVTDPERRAIADLIDNNLATPIPGDACLRGQHPDVECDSWLAPTLAGQHRHRHWNHTTDARGGAQ